MAADGAIEGEIESVGPRHDFELRTFDGELLTRTCWGDKRRYVAGLQVKLVRTHPPPGFVPSGALEADGGIDMLVQVERSDARGTGLDSGPGGIGIGLAGVEGDAVHYLVIPGRKGPKVRRRRWRRTRVDQIRGREAWRVECWTPKVDQIEREAQELRSLAAELGGDYDGGEVVGGSVWGPSGPGG